MSTNSNQIGSFVLEHMRERGGTWYAYAPATPRANSEGFRFLKVGAGSGYRRPPQRFPDTPNLGCGFDHLLAGVVDLELGVVRPVAQRVWHPSAHQTVFNVGEVS